MSKPTQTSHTTVGLFCGLLILFGALAFVINYL